jgi:predicted Zn-dependent protease
MSDRLTASHAFCPQERAALLVLGYLHLEQQRPDEAATLLRPLYREKPDDGEVARCLALAELSSGRPEVAARLSAHAYTHAPLRARKAVGLIYAKALWLTGDEPGAREVLRKLLAPKESSPG